METILAPTVPSRSAGSRRYSPSSQPVVVGIYIGNGQIIHARYSVGKITIDSLSASYYASRYVGAKRIA